MAKGRRTGSAIPLALFGIWAGLGLWSAGAEAAPRGSEFDLTLTPATGAMEGAGIARPQDPIAMIFGNPATMTQMQGTDSGTLGMSFVSPDLEATSDGSNPNSGPFDGESRLDKAVLPHAGIIHRFTDQLVGGFGFTGISGLGSDFRRVSGAPPLVADLKLFGGNFAGAYAITPELSIGGTLTLGIGALQVGLLQNTASVNGFGVGGTVGGTYDLGPVQLGATYKSPLSIEYPEVIETSDGKTSDFTLEQPQEFVFGIATTDRLFKDTPLENTLLEFDFRYKNWDNAEGYGDFWKDQYVFSLGAQHKLDAFSFRAGYSYGTDLRKDSGDLGNNIGDIDQVFVPGFGVVPVTPQFIELFQATLTNGYWRQSVSAGVGYDISESFRFDLNAGYGFDVDEEFGAFDVGGAIFAAGMGVTWTFN